MPRTRALALLALTLVACKNPERDELISVLDDYEYERESTRYTLCTCPAELGFTTSDECEAAEPSLGAAEKECIADAFEGDEALGVDYYSCVTPLLREYGLCLLDQLGTCGMDWDEPCTSNYETAVEDTCPTLSSAKEAAVLDCSS